MAGKRFILGFILSLAFVFFSWLGARPAQASCGAVSCFVVIGSQQQVPMAGLLTVNAISSAGIMALVTLVNGKTDEFVLTIPSSFRGESEFGQADVPVKSVAKQRW